MCIARLFFYSVVLVGKCFKMVEEMKQSLSDRFKMQDLGQLHHFLGIKVLQNLVEGKVWIGQPNYVQKMLERFSMQDSKPVSTPSAPDSKLVKRTADDEEADLKKYQSAGGSLIYLSTKTRPDIDFVVGNVARICSEPTKVHFSAVKRIMRYLKGTQDLGLLYCKHSTAPACIGYSDAD